MQSLCRDISTFTKVNKYNQGMNEYDLQPHWPAIPAVGYLWSHPSCSLAQVAVAGCCSEQSQLSSLAQRSSPARLYSLPRKIKRAVCLL